MSRTEITGFKLHLFLHLSFHTWLIAAELGGISEAPARALTHLRIHNSPNSKVYARLDSQSDCSAKAKEVPAK